jgi:hypothetical protein
MSTPHSVIVAMPLSKRAASTASDRSGSSVESELLFRGYTRRTTASEPRLSEIVAEYRRIGFEVELIEHRVERGQCGICFGLEAGAAVTYHDVFVRSAPTPKD